MGATRIAEAVSALDPSAVVVNPVVGTVAPALAPAAAAVLWLHVAAHAIGQLGRYRMQGKRDLTFKWS